MSGLMDKVGDKANQMLDKKSQPGNGVEGKADSGINNDLNQAAGDAGVPQQADGMMDKVADAKANSDIPFGNN